MDSHFSLSLSPMLTVVKPAWAGSSDVLARIVSRTYAWFSRHQELCRDFRAANPDRSVGLLTRFCFVFLTHGRMPVITRGIRTFPANVLFAGSSRSLPRRTPTSERLFFRRIFPIAFRLRFWSSRGWARQCSTLVLIVTESADVSLCELPFCIESFLLAFFHRRRVSLCLSPMLLSRFFRF